MTSKNIRLGLTVAAIYLVSVAAALALIGWIGSNLQMGAFHNLINAKYAIGLAIGLIVAFLGGYFYNPLLDKSITQYNHDNPDTPIHFATGICRAKLLSRYWGYAAAVCIPLAALIFALTGEAYIEGLCLLLPIGFISLFFSIHYKSKIRETMRERFRSQPL